MFEEVAELLEARGIHYGPALPMLIGPEAIPVLQKAPRDLERWANRTGKGLIKLGLLARGQMIWAAQHEITA